MKKKKNEFEGGRWDCSTSHTYRSADLEVKAARLCKKSHTSLPRQLEGV